MRKLVNLCSKCHVSPSHQLDELWPRRWSWWPLCREHYWYSLRIALLKFLPVIIIFTPHTNTPSDVVITLTPWCWNDLPSCTHLVIESTWAEPRCSKSCICAKSTLPEFQQRLCKRKPSKRYTSVPVHLSVTGCGKFSCYWLRRRD